MGIATARTIRGTVRLGRRTKELVHRLNPGEIAVIDHPSLDRTAARELIECGVAAVVNVAPSTGRRPCQGPSDLVSAGIELVDAPAGFWRLVTEGDELALDGGRVLVGGELVAECERREEAELAAELDQRRDEVGETLRAFAENTLLLLREETELLTGSPELPPIRTSLEGRHVLVVARGDSAREDLASLRPYVHRESPVLLAVDGGADLILDEGLVPDAIVGDMDSATDSALSCGAELLVHAYPNCGAPGARRLSALGLSHDLLPLPGTSQDAALLLAHGKGAELLVSVGAPLSAAEFLDRGREGMSSSFLTRLRVGDRLVDAAGARRILSGES